MSVTLERMAKNPQVRVAQDLIQAIGIISKAFGETVPRYVDRVLRQAVERDWAKARKSIDRIRESADGPGDEA